MRSVEVEDVVKKISTLTEVRITISSNEEVVNLDKVFSFLKSQTSILSLSISMDESFYETCFYDFFSEKTRKNFKVRLLQCESCKSCLIHINDYLFHQIKRLFKPNSF